MAGSAAMRYRTLPSVLVVVIVTLLAACTGPPASSDGPLEPVRVSSVPAGPPAPGQRVMLRQLVIGTDAQDIGVATWKTVLDRIGTPYDVHLAHEAPLDAATFVTPDGIGR